MNRTTTSQKAAQAVGGIYDLVLIAANRVREIRLENPKNKPTSKIKDIHTALSEIEEGKVGREYLLKDFNQPGSKHR